MKILILVKPVLLLVKLVLVMMFVILVIQDLFCKKVDRNV
jgi:hypothetical protein